MTTTEMPKSRIDRFSTAITLASLSAQLVVSSNSATAATLSNESLSGGEATAALRVSTAKTPTANYLSPTNNYNLNQAIKLVPDSVYNKRVSPLEAVSKFNTNASVVIDFAHEDTANSWTWISALQKSGFNVAENGACLTDIPSKINTVLISQATTPVKFFPEEITAIEKFVNAGGSLVIVASKDSPATEVAKAFGIEVVKDSTIKSPLSLSSYLCKSGNKPPAINTPLNWRFAKPGAEAAMIDSNGKAVGIRCYIGSGSTKGTVVCLPHLGEDWQISTDNLADLMQGTLPAGVRPSAQKGLAASFPTEMSLEKNGCKFTWPAPLTPWAKPAIEDLLKAQKCIEKRLMVQADPKRPYSFSLGAGSNFGMTPSSVILPIAGMPIDDEAWSFPRELAHHYSTGLPLVFEQARAYLCEVRVKEELDPLHAGKEARTKWNENMRLGQNDNRMDMSACGKVPVETWFGRAMWMIEKLEGAFGPEFMPKVVAANGVLQIGQKRLTLSEFSSVLTDVARNVAGPDPKVDGQPMAKWLESVGLPPATKPIRTQDIYDKTEAAIKNTPVR